VQLLSLCAVVLSVYRDLYHRRPLFAHSIDNIERIDWLVSFN